MSDLPPAGPAPIAALTGEQVLALLAEMLRAAEPAVQPELLTRKQTAALLAISLSELSSLESSGGVPEPVCLGTGRCVRYSARELRAWVASGCPMRPRWAAMRESAMRRRSA